VEAIKKAINPTAAGRDSCSGKNTNKSRDASSNKDASKGRYAVSSSEEGCWLQRVLKITYKM
jgi:hypothetical protein